MVIIKKKMLIKFTLENINLTFRLVTLSSRPSDVCSNTELQEDIVLMLATSSSLIHQLLPNTYRRSEIPSNIYKEVQFMTSFDKTKTRKLLCHKNRFHP